jgi:hypothetical protein
VLGAPFPQLRFRFADAVEGVFGPDPGLLRLQLAARTVVSTSITLTALLLWTGGTLQAAASIALAFAVSMFANINVRDPKARQQAWTLALLALPALGACVLASFLSHWPWIADVGFIVVVTLAVFARPAGPRWMALAMVGYISYFIGVIIHPPLASAPQLAASVAIALAAAALTRFALLRDSPRLALQQVRLHIDRRIDRILDEADIRLEEGRRRRSESEVRRSHIEMAQLNDALLVAQDQIEALEGPDDDARLRLSACFFRLELAAERLMRLAARHPDLPDHRQARERIAALRGALRAGQALRQPPGQHRSADEKLLGSLDELQRALGDVFAVTEQVGAG